MIDIHSHILPGIDDGAETFEDSVNIVCGLVSQGVTDIIATPHYVDETKYTVPYDENKILLENLRAGLDSKGINVNIFLGNEIYINDKIPELLEKNIITTLADSKYLLIELPLNGEYQSYEDIFADLMERGYNVLLAHPERYEITQEKYQTLVDLCDMGVLLQCNLGSVIGKYGKGAQKLVKKLAKEKRIFAFGSDIHHPNRNNFVSLAQKKLSKFYDEKSLEQVLVKNSEKILGR